MIPVHPFSESAMNGNLTTVSTDVWETMKPAHFRSMLLVLQDYQEQEIMDVF